MSQVLKYSAASIIGVIVVAAAVYFFMARHVEAPKQNEPVAEVPKGPAYAVIGTSVQGRKIESYTYGTGAEHVVFVGGIHGGYEWNTVLLAYQFKDYLDAHPDVIAPSTRVTIIPNANPDGVYSVVKKEGRFTENDVPQGDVSYGRFNADEVDLNRNFDCKWQPTGTWQNKTVSAGSDAFSEPEAKALHDYALNAKPSVMVFWHSAAGGVYASQCGSGILSETLSAMQAYAEAADYPAVKEFTAYEVHGASEDWLASIGIPAITVELKTHSDVEFDQNLKGALAVIRSASLGK